MLELINCQCARAVALRIQHRRLVHRALIIAAVFWTWLWGPIGLVLATPLTVCLAVMGRHVPKLQFLSVLLSEEQALAPHEECYHRLLAFGLDEANDLAEAYVKTKSHSLLFTILF